MKQFRYDVDNEGRLVQGVWAENGSDELKHGRDDDTYWITDKRQRIGHWRLDEDGDPVEYTPEEDAEQKALFEIKARQQYGPDLIAKISLKITSENVTLTERLALNPLISAVTILLQAGSFQDALAAINAQDTTALSDEAVNVLLYADEIIQDAVDTYY